MGLQFSMQVKASERLLRDLSLGDGVRAPAAINTITARLTDRVNKIASDYPKSSEIWLTQNHLQTPTCECLCL